MQTRLVLSSNTLNTAGIILLTIVAANEGERSCAWLIVVNDIIGAHAGRYEQSRLTKNHQIERHPASASLRGSHTMPQIAPLHQKDRATTN
jgi:hypothetical protein